MLDVEWSTPPGSGFCDREMIPRHTALASTAKNFGSSSPNFSNIINKETILEQGPCLNDLNDKDFWNIKSYIALIINK